MGSLYSEFYQSQSEIMDRHSSCLLALLDKDGLIHESNPRLEQLRVEMNRACCLSKLLARGSRAVLNRILTQASNGEDSGRQILHFLRKGHTLPVSYGCVLTQASEDRFFFYAEPEPAMDDDQAREYAMVNSELAVVTRQLQKTNHELADRSRILQALNERLNQEMAERERVENELAEIRKSELQIGAQIQKALLIGHPPTDIRGVSIAATSIPSQTVDGDFYSFFRYSDRCFDVTLGDVMGKGVLAALIGAATRSLLQKAIGALIYESDARIAPEPHAIVQMLHQDLTQQLSNLEKFVTLNYSRFDLDARTYTFVDCGHTKTVHYSRADDSCRLLSGSNTPLGILPDQTYMQTTEPIGEGDILFFYSDGLSDAASVNREEYGEARIADMVYKCRELSADEIGDAFTQDLESFTDSRGSRDDLTYVVVKIG